MIADQPCILIITVTVIVVESPLFIIVLSIVFPANTTTDIVPNGRFNHAHTLLNVHWSSVKQTVSFFFFGSSESFERTSNNDTKVSDWLIPKFYFERIFRYVCQRKQTWQFQTKHSICRSTYHNIKKKITTIVIMILFILSRF